MAFFPDPTKVKAKRKNRDQARSGSGKSFPSDLLSERNSKAMKFSFFDYVKPDTFSSETRDPLGSVNMYMPPQLVVNDQLSYNDFDGGIEYGGFMAGSAGARGAVNRFNDFASGNSPSGIDMGELGRALGEGAAAFGTAALGSVASQYADIGSVVAGKSLNPRVLSKFERVGFRTYQFTWLMVAKTIDESEAIRDIVHEFRYHAHPEKTSSTGAFFDYPSLVTFEYMPEELNKWLWKPNPCAITSVNVEFSSAGTPKFFKGTNAPVECLLSIQLKEMLIDTKEEIAENYERTQY